MSQDSDPNQKSPANKKTDLLSDPFVGKPITKSLRDVQTFKVEEHKRVNLIILGVPEVIDFKVASAITLGRFGSVDDTNDIFDLTAYGAHDRGVSRRHCQLELKNGRIELTDLDSTNGTFVNGEKLQPNQPHILKKGEEIILGRLPINVMSET